MARVLSGMRPTGRMHIGHYLSVLLSYVEMQHQHECFFLVADLHVLTTSADKTSEIKENIFQMACDWFAAGIDPQKSAVLVQSEVPIHYNLYLVLSMLTPTGWLERNPTVKDMVRDMNLQDSVGHGLLGYPVLQAADILAYKANLVPIGKDQRAHLEISREITRRFNSMYGETFPEPQEFLRNYPLIPGMDGRKMSKSLDNAVFLSDGPQEIQQKISQMITDPEKIRKADPGHPDICSVYDFHKILKTPNLEDRAEGCKKGELGCVACKKELAAFMDGIIAPLREKRAGYESNPKMVWEILNEGSRKANEFTTPIWNEVKERMGLAY